MLNDLFGYFKRNIKKMNHRDIEKAYREMKSIVNMLERELKLNY